MAEQFFEELVPHLAARRVRYYGIALVVTVFAIGCESPDPPVPAVQAGDTEELPEIAIPDKFVVIDKPPGTDALSDRKSFTHEQTGVTFDFPTGWDVQEPRVEGWVARIELTRDGGFRSRNGVDASVYFGRTSTAENSERAMLAKEFKEMGEVHGDGLELPERIRVGDRDGFRLSIRPPLPGLPPDSKFHRHVYYFFVDSTDTPDLPSLARGKWTVSIWIDAEADNLEKASEVLHGFSWR